uniref:Uncharacterized protein n=1 Tax=Vitis vinifera TaxID=29760 RepID=A5C269_VITVI|nr:hypothetical protein VITISV_040030 [Vitis vinifera]
MGRPTILTQASLSCSSSIKHPVIWLHFSSRMTKPPTDISPSSRAFSASVIISNSSNALPSSNLAKPKSPFNPHNFAIWVPQLHKSSPPPSIGFQLPTRQWASFSKFTHKALLSTFTLATSSPVLRFCLTTSAKDFSNMGIQNLSLSFCLTCPPGIDSISRSASTMRVQPPFAPLPLGIKILNLFFSQSVTPRRRKHPPLFSPRTKEKYLPFSCQRFSQWPVLMSFEQKTRPSMSGPKLVGPNLIQEETPPFLSTIKICILPFFFSFSTSKVFDSTPKLLFRPPDWR